MNAHQTLSQVIEIFGFVMQAAILILLIVRGQWRRFPAFALVLVYFLLRTSLFFTAGHFPNVLKSITPVQWSNIIIGFSIAEDVLQAAVVVELVFWLLPALQAWRLRTWWKLAAGAVVAGGFLWVMLAKLAYWPNALLMTHKVPTLTLVLMNSQVGLVAVTSELLLLAALAVVALAAVDADPTSTRLLASKFALGWGVFASVNLIGLAVEHYSARTANFALRERMQFIVIGSYVLMIILWLVSLVLFSTRKMETAKTEAAAAN